MKKCTRKMKPFLFVKFSKHLQHLKFQIPSKNIYRPQPTSIFSPFSFIIYQEIIYESEWVDVLKFLRLLEIEKWRMFIATNMSSINSDFLL